MIKTLAKFSSVLISMSLITTSLYAIEPNNILLPNPFPVYTNGNVVINHAYPGFVKKELPINNDYNKNPGCYMACYSHDGKNAVYAVSKNIFVLGMIRIPGKYSKRICIPDITPKQNYQNYPLPTICNRSFKSCGNSCWVGGDTAGFYGIQ